MESLSVDVNDNPANEQNLVATEETAPGETNHSEITTATELPGVKGIREEELAFPATPGTEGYTVEPFEESTKTATQTVSLPMHNANLLSVRTRI